MASLPKVMVPVHKSLLDDAKAVSGIQLRKPLFGTNPRLAARLLSRTGVFFALGTDPPRPDIGCGGREKIRTMMAEENL